MIEQVTDLNAELDPDVDSRAVGATVPDGFDVTVQDAGSLVILYPQTTQAQAWMDEHLPDDVQTWGHNGVVVEPRYVSDIIDGMREDGLTV